MIIDMIDTKLYKTPQPKKKKSFSKYHIKLEFSDKSFDFIKGIGGGPGSKWAFY